MLGASHKQIIKFSHKYNLKRRTRRSSAERKAVQEKSNEISINAAARDNMMYVVFRSERCALVKLDLLCKYDFKHHTEKRKGSFGKTQRWTTTM